MRYKEKINNYVIARSPKGTTKPARLSRHACGRQVVRDPEKRDRRIGFSKKRFAMTYNFMLQKSFILFFLLLFFVEITHAQYYYAAVYSNADNPSVGSVNNNGVFRRAVSDTAWIKIRANFYAFGLGRTQFGLHSQHYIAGGNGLHRSADGGATWKVLTGWQTKEILSVAPDPIDSSVIYVATPFGIFKSTDAGGHWAEAMKGFKTSYTRHVVIDRTNHNTLYAAAEDALYKSTDAGTNWKAIYSGNTEIKCVLQLPNDAKRLLVGTEDKGVQFSTDGGQHWKPAAGIPQSAIYDIGSSVDGATTYAGGYKTGVWKSEDKGERWSQVWSAPEIEAIYCMFIDPHNARHLLVGTNGKGIFESSDQAKTWRQAGLPSAHVKQIESYP